MTRSESIKTKQSRAFIILLIFFVVFSFIPPDMAYAEDEINCDAVSAIVVNETRDLVLYEKDPDLRAYPASTTKVLTALVIAESVETGRYSLDDTFAAYKDLYFDIPSDGSTAYIKAGEIMTVRDYLHCALLSSANEACNALAVNDSGSVDAFVQKMNEKAAELGCENSHFSDTHGIHHDDHYSTARDMYRIFRAVMEDPIISKICSTKEYVVPETNKTDERELYNTNILMRQGFPFYYEYALAGKTGFTDEAGTCLVSCAEKDGEELICVVLGADFVEYEEGKRAPASFSVARDLYEWCYSEYGEQPVLKGDKAVTEVPVMYGKDTETVSVVPADDVFYYMKRSDSENKVEYDVRLDVDNLMAPVEAGTPVGEADAVFNGEVIGTSPLVTADNVSVSALKLVKDNHYAQLALAAAVLIILIFILGILSVNKRAKIRRNNRGGRT